MSIPNREVTYFSFVLIMFRLERMGHRYLERKLGEDDQTYLLRTKEAFPGMFDDMITKKKPASPPYTRITSLPRPK